MKNVDKPNKIAYLIKYYLDLFFICFAYSTFLLLFQNKFLTHGNRSMATLKVCSGGR